MISIENVQTTTTNTTFFTAVKPIFFVRKEFYFITYDTYEPHFCPGKIKIISVYAKNKA